MADINHVITLGIGTPADIPHFTLFGLSPTGPVTIVDIDLCEATVMSLMPERSVESLMPVRTVERVC